MNIPGFSSKKQGVLARSRQALGRAWTTVARSRREPGRRRARRRLGRVGAGLATTAAVLAAYRGFDTLGEVTVVFVAAIGVLMLLRRPGEKED